MSLFPIFKINKLTNKNLVDTIYVFYGQNYELDLDLEKINKLFISDPYNINFATIFDKKELDMIVESKTTVIFVNALIVPT